MRTARAWTSVVWASVMVACAPVRTVVAPRSPESPRASAAPSASAPNETAPPVSRSPCAALEEHSARALRDDRARARTFVETLVMRDEDPMASERDVARAEVDRQHASGDHEALARAEAALVVLRVRHVEAQLPERFGVEREVVPNAMQFLLGHAAPSCWPAGAGAWGLVFDEVRSHPAPTDGWSDPWIVNARVAIAYADAAGVVQTAPFTSFLHPGPALRGWPDVRPRDANCCASNGGARSYDARTFDYDGDGAPEVLVHSSYGEGHAVRDWAEVYTVRGGRLQPYPFARVESLPLKGIEDLDGDDRPDPYSYLEVVAGQTCDTQEVIAVHGPRFPALSGPDGRLDFSGAAARAYARSWCPRAPAAPSTVEEVVCARLWTRSDGAVLRSIERRYDPWDCATESDGVAQASRRAIRHYEALVRAVEAPLPFRLAR